MSKVQAHALLASHTAEILENTASMQFMHSGADPLNEKEADESPFAQQWTEAKWKELDSLRHLHCLDYVDPSDAGSEKIYNGKFCFAMKPAANNQPARNKARWVFRTQSFTNASSMWMARSIPSLQLYDSRHYASSSLRLDDEASSSSKLTLVMHL